MLLEANELVPQCLHRVLLFGCCGVPPRVFALTAPPSRWIFPDTLLALVFAHRYSGQSSHCIIQPVFLPADGLGMKVPGHCHCEGWILGTFLWSGAWNSLLCCPRTRVGCSLGLLGAMVERQMSLLMRFVELAE